MPASAQTGRLAGHVSLPDNLPATQAQVVLKKTKQSAVTDSAGRFAINGIPTETYSAEVDAEKVNGFYEFNPADGSAKSLFNITAGGVAVGLVKLSQ